MTAQPGANTQPTGDRSHVHDELVRYRAKLVGDYEAITARHERNLTEIDAAIAAVMARRMPQVGVEYERCGNCGGPIVSNGSWWVHDRDGQAACKPGHSGPVAQPMDQTSRWPAVPPAEDATQVLPAVPADQDEIPWAVRAWLDGTPYVYDGLTYDLRRCLVDSHGTVWGLLGYRLAPGPAPLMAAEAGVWQDAGPNVATRTGPEMPLAELVTQHGPLRYEDGSLPRAAQPADLDQETATPAVTTPDGQASES